MKKPSVEIRPTTKVVKIDKIDECNLIPEHFFQILVEMPKVQKEMMALMPSATGEKLRIGETLEMTIRLLELCERFDVNLAAIYKYNRECYEQQTASPPGDT